MQRYTHTVVIVASGVAAVLRVAVIFCIVLADGKHLLAAWCCLYVVAFSFGVCCCLVFFCLLLLCLLLFCNRDPVEILS